MSTRPDEDSDRVQQAAAALRAAAEAAGMWLSADGRIGEADLAKLLGWASGTLRNRRRAGGAPPSYRLGGSGHRVTYNLGEVAEWIAAGRTD